MRVTFNIADLRYSDFAVNEVGLDGEVIVLKDITYDAPSMLEKTDDPKHAQPKQVHHPLS